MTSETPYAPLRLDIAAAVVAVYDQQLVVIESAPVAGMVGIRDLATDQRCTVRISVLRGRPALLSAQLNARLEQIGEPDDAQ